MRFGLWDHVDRSDRPLHKQLDERLAYLIAGDEAGFHCIHIAEHHATPLNMVPVPGVYLGAVARLTQRMRLGPLCYLLPLYSPLRLIEEIGILDNMCHGRLELGVGRGVSPFELNYHNVDHATSREVYQETLEILIKGMTSERLNHEGKRYKYTDVPMEIRPYQQPHPPIWYPSSTAKSATHAGAQGYNYVTLGPRALAAKNIAAFKAAFKERGGAMVPSPHFKEGVAIGVNRHVVIADTDAEARRIAEPAHEMYHASLTKLWRENQTTTPVASVSVSSLDQAVDSGAVIVGSPDTVRAEIERQITELGCNYMIFGMFFGNIAYEHAMRSLDLMAKEVIPKIRTAGAAAE